MSELPVDADARVTERFIEKLETQVERLNYLAVQHESQPLRDVHHKMWLLTRVLRGDPELSLDDIE